MIKKVCVVTAARSEYGLLRWIMEEFKNDSAYKLQVVVSGSHLSPEFGSTYREIEKDGFEIDEKVEMLVSSDTPTAAAASMGLCSIGMGPVLQKLAPDLLIILGDRFELLPICGAAVVMNIPIAHLSGGDITEGALDNQVRHGVTKMAHIHFPGNDESAERIIQMGEEPDRVYNVGEPGLDSFTRIETLSRDELAQKYGLDPAKKWVLLTYHPETMAPIEHNLTTLNSLLEALKKRHDFQVIITGANNDPGGNIINDTLKGWAEKNSGSFQFHMSLGQLNYLSMMKQVFCLAGNSSSGIFEAPTVKKPVINIGERQKGRICAENIVTVPGTPESIAKALQIIESPAFTDRLESVVSPYGDGKTAEKVKDTISRLLHEKSREELLHKKFYTKSIK